MPDTESFVEPPGGRFAIGCISVFLAIPAVLGTVVLAINLPAFSPIPIVVSLILLAISYYVFNEEVRVDIDEQGLRLSRERVVFGIRVARRTEWEVPLAALTGAREVRTKSPANRGGWNRQTFLQFPNGRTLHASDLGGDEAHDSAYSALVRSLQQRLGDRFERDNRAV